VATIYHGIELDQYTFSARSGEYLAFLGRIALKRASMWRYASPNGPDFPCGSPPAGRLPFKNDPDVRKDWSTSKVWLSH